MSLAIAFLACTAMAQVPSIRPQYPPGCEGPTFPDAQECLAKGWDLGSKQDQCAPVGPYPVVGQQVYIQDPLNFCINLPDPNSALLKREVYSKGRLPTFVQGEGFVQSFCTGEYSSPGALKLPFGGVRSAHVVKGIYKNGKRYMEISGYLDCEVLGMNCTGSGPGVYDDGGQYDAVSFRQCGKAPYSGVDASKHPGFLDYTQQAGNGIFL